MAAKDDAMPRVFISYCRTDTKFATRLATAFRGLGFEIWIDTDGIAVGERWTAAVQDGLETCDALVLVVTPEAISSRNVEDEWQYALELGKPVIPVQLRPTRRPFQLSRVQFVDFSERTFDEALSRLVDGIREILARIEPASAPVAEPAARSAWRTFRSTCSGIGDLRNVGSRLRDGKRTVMFATSAVVGAGMLFASMLWSGQESQGEGTPTPPTEELQALLDVVLDFSRPPEERAEAGRNLADIGDPRPGVGLRPDGVPEIDWVQVLGGSFLMGDEDEPLWEGAWEARRSVYVAEFHISRYETTWVQYKAFLTADDGYDNSDWWDGLAERQQEPGVQSWPLVNHPAENVSWLDAMAYTRWLSTRLGYEVRLPTEEEWEKAARGTDGRRYPWGDEYDAGRANIDERSPKEAPMGPNYMARTTAVGIYFQDNPYGLADMSGSVWEWTLTEWDSKRSDQLGSGAARVGRGGSWIRGPGGARVAGRLWQLPVYRDNSIGFRVVSSAPLISSQ